MYFVIRVPDVERGKSFYTKVFGWGYDSGGNVVGAWPAGRVVGGAAARISVSVGVADVGATVARARELGGGGTEPVRSGRGWDATVDDGRGGMVEIWQRGLEYSDGLAGVGDLFYFVLPVVDDTAREFFGSVLGWEYSRGSHAGGWNVLGVTPAGGIFVGGEAGTIVPYFRVEDVDLVAELVRRAGGTAGPILPSVVGTYSVCRDDQGASFGIGALRAG